MMLGWLYWNPSRVCFYIPYLNYPIYWYGFLFALGFVFGHFIFYTFAKRFFLRSPFLAVGDIKDYSALILNLKLNSSHVVIHNFLNTIPDTLKEKIFKTSQNSTIDQGFKKSLIFAFNHYIEQGESFKLQRRSDLEQQLSSIQKISEKTKSLTDSLFLYVCIGAVIGARVGHLLFYEEITFYLKNPLNIFKVWEGGLASHGGFAGVFLSIYLFCRKYKQIFVGFDYLRTIDFLAVSLSLGAFFIRIGNFFNQEILGKATKAPWGIIFGSPFDGSTATPRHPAQLYEGFFQLALCLFVLVLSRKESFFNSRGKIAGLVIVLGSTFRFFLEFLKENLSVYDGSLLNMGQLLSIPMIIFGLSLYFSSAFVERKSRLSCFKR